jgi:hypothetical protein
VAAIVGIAIAMLREIPAPSPARVETANIPAPTEQQKSEYAADERQFWSDLDTAGAALDRSSSGWFYLQDGKNPWQRELDTLKHDMSKYESTNN